MPNVVHTFNSLPSMESANETALRFSTVLAADKGVSSKVQKLKNGYRVLADDGKAVDFLI